MHSQAMGTSTSVSWEANSLPDSGDSTESYQKLDSGTLCTTKCLCLILLKPVLNLVLDYLNKNEAQVYLQKGSDSIFFFFIRETIGTFLKSHHIGFWHWGGPAPGSRAELHQEGPQASAPRSSAWPTFPWFFLSSRRYNNGLLPWKHFTVASHRTFLACAGELDKTYLTAVIIKYRRRK